MHFVFIRARSFRGGLEGKASAGLHEASGRIG